MQPAIFSIQSIGAGMLYAMAKPKAGDTIEQEFEGIAAFGITRIISLLEVPEAQAAGLACESQLTQDNGMQFVQFSIPDFQVPASVPLFSEFIKRQYQAILEGQHTVVHCHAGIGRTGMVTASMLMHSGFTPLEAFKEVSSRRGQTVPDKQEQIDWVVQNQLGIVGS